jgi:hypothetical protein
MGHTHTPISGLTDSCIRYVNAGFNCPSIPDVGTKNPTFVSIDADNCRAEVYAVSKTGSGGYTVQPCFPPPAQDRIDYLGLNFSRYVEIDNQSAQNDLVRVDYGVTNGHYINLPLEIVRAGARERFWIQDYTGIHGSAGWATYEYTTSSGAKRPIYLTFGCPTGIYTSYADGDGYFGVFTKIGGVDADWNSGVAPKGHPFHVAFVRSSAG